jgi:hypothetical protein
MGADSSFPVEDFLEAITAQLDRTQDALRLKSVTRPLTYAIRDFSLELKVFVELAADGKVMFRPSGANDVGASVVSIGFTTVNRTMIEENTVSLSSVKSPTLDELGLDEQERRQLEKLGVRNAAQLDQLGKATSDATVSRYSGLPVNRLRQAMMQGRPMVESIDPVDDEPADHVSSPAVDPDFQPSPAAGGSGPIRLPGRTRRLKLSGTRLDETARGARLNGAALSVRPVEGGVEVDLGKSPMSGTLHLDLGEHGETEFSLEFDAETPDPWRPQ